MDNEMTRCYRAPFINFSPFVFLNEQGEKTGYMIKFLHVLQILDNITVSVIPNADEFWGAKVNNSWNGLLGMLERNEADFAITPLFVTSDRFNAFPSSHPFLISRTQIVFGTNQSTENDIFSVVNIWLVVLFFGVALLIYMTGKLNSKYGKAKSELPFMFLLQCLLGTSPQSLNCNGISRFLSVSWSLASFILLLFVSSEMTSQYSSQSEALPFDTIDDVFQFPEANPLFMKGSAPLNLVQKIAQYNAAFAEVMKRADANPESCYLSFGTLLQNEGIVSGIENREKFLISVESHNWNIIKNRYAKTGSCKMKLSQQPLIINYWALYFNKNVSQALIKTVNRRLLQLTEGDCLMDLNPSLKNELHPCQKTETPDAFVVINVSAFMVIFRVCLIGFFASFVTVILEICVHMLQVSTKAFQGNLFMFG